MSNNYILIRLDNEAIYLNNSLVISYKDTNLPKDHFKFKTTKPIYWKVRQVLYLGESNSLTVEVVDFRVVEHDEFADQQPKLPVHSLLFWPLDWLIFQDFIYSYTLNKIRHALRNVPDPPLSESRKKPSEEELKQFRADQEAFKRSAPNLFHQEVEQVEDRIIEVKVKFEESYFGDQQIRFTAKYKPAKETWDLVIENTKIKREFEHIKPWFIKKIGKSFTVSITLRFLGRQWKPVLISSPEIDRINEELIEEVKTDIVKQLLRVEGRDPKKEIYTEDEVFRENTDDENALNLDANQILQILIKDGKAKNVKQLEFLSKEKQQVNEQIRFTLKPKFGFLFKIRTLAHDFYLWELLDSHATYIWQIAVEGKSRRDEFYAIITQAISFIKANGREAYKKEYKRNGNKNYVFHFLEHVRNDLTQDESFELWKLKLHAIVK